MVRRTLGAIALALAAAAPLAAQAPYLVKDLNLITATQLESSLPAHFAAFGSRVYFAATTGIGTEPWSTDGTAAGTALVADVYRSGSSFPSGFVVVNGTLLFMARDSRGFELWTTDGTANGTRLLADIAGGSASSLPGPGIVYRDSYLFPATESISGRELWITDGTPAGTRLLKDLSPGTSSSSPSGFTVLNDRVYFGANGGLWRTDGTESGTVKIASVGADESVAVGSRLFFTNYTEANGQELWVSDGTEGGTQVIDLVPGKNGSVSYRASLTPFGNGVLFVADDGTHGRELWFSDGTLAGTRMVRDIVAGKTGALANWSWPLAVIGGVAYFGADDGQHGMELWRTDGTEGGTALVRDVIPGNAPSGIYALTVMSGRLYFLSNRASQAWRIWSTDGTEEGTRMLRPNDPPSVGFGFGDNVPSAPLTAIGGTLYFAGSTPLTGYEPWKSDGTDDGTVMITNIAVDPAPGSDPSDLVAAGDQIFFNAWDGIGTITSAGGEPRKFWRSDGTPEGTIQIAPKAIINEVAVGRSILAIVDTKPWTSDGTPEGTGPATDFTNRFPATPFVQYVFGDTILASVAKGFSDSELYATKLAAGSPAVALGSKSGSSFVNIAGRAFYVSDGGLWTTDGTPAGTYAVVPDLNDATALTPAHGVVYFLRKSGKEIWKSDGTFEGTVLVASTTDTLGQLIPAGTKLFAAGFGKVWLVEGGTLRQLATSYQLSNVPTIASAGERIVFRGTDTTNGAELWVSDGTAEGTHILRDILPGNFGSSPSELLSVDGVVYFQAFDLEHSQELWSTDGTPEGTHLVADIEPGTSGSYPRSFTRAGQRLFFNASTTTSGYELWALPLPQTPRLSVADVRATESDANVRFNVTLAAAATQSVTVDFATSDGTATAGSDYDAASGTLTFAPGETSKSVDVHLRADTAAENNETIILTLRNASGASLAKPTGFAVVEDDDQIADLSAAINATFWSNYAMSVDAANAGPRTATGVKIRATATPADVAASTCNSCPSAPRQLTPGASARAFEYRWLGFQQYLTATVSAHQTDPQPANNSVGWTTNNALAMNALYLTPGAQATGWLAVTQGAASVGLESSDPSVLSVPASIAAPTLNQSTSFTIRANAIGTATIRAFIGSTTVATLAVQVVAPGTKVRYPGALKLQITGNTLQFDQAAIFTFYLTGTAPFNGQRATGLVTLSAGGKEIERVTLVPGDLQKTISGHLPNIGANVVTLQYAGDENFLPQTETLNLSVTLGAVSILANAEKSGSTVVLHVRVNGSPLAAPTGTVSANIGGVVGTATLAAGASPGVATADIIVANAPGSATKAQITYSGDGHYYGTKNDIGIPQPHRRAVRH